MKYPDCTIDNPEDARFYNGCDHPPELICPSCNQLNSPNSTFCIGLGQSVMSVSKTTSKELSSDEITDNIQGCPQRAAEKILYPAQAPA